MMGGKMSHEYMYLTPMGEDTLLFCDSCGYSANRQISRFYKPAPPEEAPRPVEKISTPGTKTIDDLARLLGVPASRTAKAVFLMATLAAPEEPASMNPGAENGPRPPVEQFIFAVVRGDTDVNETKLSNILKARDLRPATEQEIRAAGAVPGYASPYGLSSVRVVVDDLIPVSPNLVSGANEEGYHLLNVNYGRDYCADTVADISAAGEGSLCPNCQAPMRVSRGVEIGNIFKLGTRYADAMGCTFTDEAGLVRPVIMGSYGIGVGRLLACIAEEHHDDLGLRWPASVAPYPVHMVLLPGKSGQPDQVGSDLYTQLTSAGLEPLYDDRSESAGVKFMDADLIGLPLRINVSERALKQGGLEFKLRATGETRIVALENVVSEVQRISTAG